MYVFLEEVVCLEIYRLDEWHAIFDGSENFMYLYVQMQKGKVVKKPIKKQTSALEKAEGCQ